MLQGFGLRQFATVIMTFFCASALLASTVDEEQLQVTHSRQAYQSQLNAEQTHTAYREETQPQTCYRQVYAGSVPECRYITEQVCTRDYYGRVWCRPVTRQVCYDRPIYRQEPYTCYQTVRIPYEVFDYYVNAAVQIFYSLAGVTSDAPAGDSILNLRLEGDDLELTGRSSAGLLLFLNERRIATRMEGNQKHLDAIYRVQAVEREQFTAPFVGGIRNLKVDQQGNLSFLLGERLNKDIVKLSLTVERRKIGKNELVFNDQLGNQHWTFTSTPEGSLVSVRLGALMSLQDSKKYQLSLLARAPIDRERLLNSADLGNTQASGELKFEFGE